MTLSKSKKVEMADILPFISEKVLARHKTENGDTKELIISTEIVQNLAQARFHIHVNGKPVRQNMVRLDTAIYFYNIYLSSELLDYNWKKELNQNAPTN